jgi:glycosyltransferase involved in cell wall biosynthesis
MSRTIITRPFSNKGGVAQFVNNLHPFFNDRIFLFKRGKRFSNKFWIIWPLIDVIRFIIFLIKIKPDKIIINSSLSTVGIFRDGLFTFLSKAFGLRAVLFIHGFNEKDLNKKYIIKNGYFKADKIFVLSSEFKEMLVQLGYDKPISHTYNPISQNLINGSFNDIIKYKNNENRNILMMARIEKSKGVFIGLEVARKFKEYDFKLHIAGMGSELNNAKLLANKIDLKNVIFHGFVSGDNKKDLLKKSDILLFPTSHNEGLPINILESLAMGVYVVTRPVAGIKDLADKYHMCLVDSLDPTAYEKIILNLINSGLPKKEIKENWLNAQVDFSPKTIFEKVVIHS